MMSSYCGIENLPNAACSPNSIGSDMIVVKQKTVAVLPVPEAPGTAAQQHVAKARAELAEIVQGHEEDEGLIKRRVPCQ